MKAWCKTDEHGEITSVFSEPLIYEGRAIYNPTNEQLTAAGYVYIDLPEPEPIPKTEPTTEERLAAVEGILNVQQQAEDLPDDKAVDVKALFPAWADHLGEQMQQGKRFYYDNRLWKVLQTHISQYDWTPDKAVSLFVEVTIEAWPEWKQPSGAHDAYNKDDQVSHNGSHWISVVDANVWEPTDSATTLWNKIEPNN